MSEPPAFFLVVAGPNGAGKSTFTQAGDNELPLIDPDQIAREINPHDPERAAIAAGKEAMRRARAFLAERRSFIQETTLSGNAHLKLMEQAKQARMRVRLVYVGLESPTLCAIRVAERVAKGGHNIPPGDIKRRYQRSLTNLKKALAIANRAQVFDNSSIRQPARRILETEKGRVIYKARDLPAWAAKAIGKTRLFVLPARKEF